MLGVIIFLLDIIASDILLFFLPGIIVNGLTIVSLPSVEKEFRISSKSAGLIVAGNDASALLLVGAISFFGTKGHKPRWMGIGVLITGMY